MMKDERGWFMRLVDLFKRWWKKPIVSHYTIDGGHLAPYPGMTDAELYRFERDMNVPRPTFIAIAKDGSLVESVDGMRWRNLEKSDGKN